MWKYSKYSASKKIQIWAAHSQIRVHLDRRDLHFLLFVIQNLWNRWDTVDFSNSKRDQIWRYCVLWGEVLAKDTTRWNVGVCSCLSLNRLNVWVWLGLSVWMKEWIYVDAFLFCFFVGGTLSLIPKGVTKCNYFPMMTVLQPIRWAHKIIPVSLRCLLCSHLLYVASRLSCPLRKWNSYLFNKDIKLLWPNNTY